jgi:hypothetical protein
LKDSWTHIGGRDAGISKKTFIIFVNGINNLYLPWMAENNEDYVIKSSQESA